MGLADGLKHVDWKLPLPLGEGWGEGAKLSAKNFLIVSRVPQHNMWFMSVSAKPSPRPSPKGRGRKENHDPSKILCPAGSLRAG